MMGLMSSVAISWVAVACLFGVAFLASESTDQAATVRRIGTAGMGIGVAATKCLILSQNNLVFEVGQCRLTVGTVELASTIQ